MRSLVAALALLAVLIGAPPSVALSASQSPSVVNTVHNLSTSGPGPYKATQESRVCIFCHTPHRARAAAPLWNRTDSRQRYLTYSSSTFQGLLTQPSGSSKLCLSCHDGSIALGSVLSMKTRIEMAPGFSHLTSGPGYLGTSLIDDHPISFDYASSRGGSSPEYRDPGSIAAPVHLDPSGRVQCTSCHDAHSNIFGDFLLLSRRYSEVCLACHQPTGWTAAAHNTSSATWNGAGNDPWPHASYGTVSENACANCHVPHDADDPPRLLAFQTEEDNCLHCHSGNVAALDVTSDLRKPSNHSPYPTYGLHDPTEDVFSMQRHSECSDCHDAHEARWGPAAAPGLPGPLLGVPGVSGSGQVLSRASFGYEVCYRCHADNHGGLIHVPRKILQANTRLEFDPTGPSFHPVEVPGKNPDVPSLMPPWTTASVVACTDCHQSDSSPSANGTGVAGPHGSIHSPLLIANYDTNDNTLESPAAYALCYRCHSRSSILGDDSFKKHEEHVAGERIPCSACHDSHGISSSQGTAINNTHLINFDTSIVSPLPKNGLMEFRDQGVRKGSCTLLCHGEEHDDEDY